MLVIFTAASVLMAIGIWIAVAHLPRGRRVRTAYGRRVITCRSPSYRYKEADWSEDHIWATVRVDRRPFKDTHDPLHLALHLHTP